MRFGQLFAPPGAGGGGQDLSSTGKCGSVRGTTYGTVRISRLCWQSHSRRTAAHGGGKNGQVDPLEQRTCTVGIYHCDNHGDGVNSSRTNPLGWIVAARFLPSPLYIRMGLPAA